MRAVDRESYDEMYRSTPAVWSGRPNRQLVVEVSGLPPGTALDAGCGEGADALWLAERGWRVTGVDFSDVALDRAAGHARARGLEDRVEWLPADLDAWQPGEGRFDLVTAHYLHSRGADRTALFARLAAAVAPGGTLLVVGHLMGHGGDDHDQHGHDQHGHDQHGHDQHGHDQHDHDQPGHGQHHDPDLAYTAEDVAAVLDPAQWRDVVTEVRDRDPAAAARTGNAVPDTVLVARRRSGPG